MNGMKILAGTSAAVIAIAAGIAGAVCWQQYDSNSCEWIIQTQHDPECPAAEPYWSAPVPMVRKSDSGLMQAESHLESNFCAVNVYQKTENGICRQVNIQTTNTISQTAFGPPCMQPFPE